MFGKLFKKHKKKLQEIIEFKYEEKIMIQKYDQYGFDSKGINMYTGTKYDRFGFNKKRNIHKDTGTPKDTSGYYRRDYRPLGKMSCSYSNLVLQNLFVNTDILNFDGEYFTDLNYENVSKIYLGSIDQQVVNYGNSRPVKLDGTPDYRYKTSDVARSSFYIVNIVYQKKEPNEKISFTFSSDEKLSEDFIVEIIERYNIFLYSLQKIETKNLYKEFLSIREKCREEKIMEIQKKKKIDIYNKLNDYNEKFTEEQHKEFENLELEIEAIKNKLVQEEDFEDIFDNIYKQLETQMKIAKINFKKIEEDLRNHQIDNEIDDLFKQLK